MKNASITLIFMGNQITFEPIIKYIKVEKKIDNTAKIW